MPSTLVSDIDGWSVVGVTVDSEDITNPPPQVCPGCPSNRYNYEITTDPFELTTVRV